MILLQSEIAELLELRTCDATDLLELCRDGATLAPGELPGVGACGLSRSLVHLAYDPPPLHIASGFYHNNATDDPDDYRELLAAMTRGATRERGKT